MRTARQQDAGLEDFSLPRGGISATFSTVRRQWGCPRTVRLREGGRAMQRWTGSSNVRHARFSAVVGVLAAGSASAQGILHLPADVPTIQGAIAKAAAGDTVVVAPGTYAEHLDFLGK